jgi:uncharacterized membrane-anchored protein YjiN (DUF445 family)
MGATSACWTRACSGWAAGWSSRGEERASQLIVRYIQREWPTLSSTVNWVKPIDEIGDSLAERLARAVLEELQQVLAEPQHPLRQDYETWLQNYVQRLREDPALAERIEQLKQEMIDPALQDYVQGLWARIHASLRADLQREDSALVGHLQRSLVRWAPACRPTRPCARPSTSTCWKVRNA